MFDVPVLEVAVSSTPAIIKHVSQASQLALPYIPSAALHALAFAPPSASHQSTDNAPSGTSNPIAQTQTLLPGGSFQELEPLNLAAAATSLAQVFTIAIPASSPQPNSPALTATVPGADVMPMAASAEADTEGDPQAALGTNASKHPVTNELPQPAPIVLRDELSQCVDFDKPAELTSSITFAVSLQGKAIGQVKSNDDVKQVIRSLQTLLGDQPINPDEIIPVLGGGQPAIRLSNDVVMQILNPATKPDSNLKASTLNHEWAAITWSDQLRQNMGAAPLDAGDVQVLFTRLQPSADQPLNGIASWYGPYFHGRMTANGEIFDQETLTAAHKTLPFNTVLQVRNLDNNRTVIVRINDRGPYIGKRSLDLSKAAARCLGSEKVGLIPYEATILETSPTAPAAAAAPDAEAAE